MELQTTTVTKNDGTIWHTGSNTIIDRNVHKVNALTYPPPPDFCIQGSATYIITGFKADGTHYSKEGLTYNSIESVPGTAECFGVNFD